MKDIVYIFGHKHPDTDSVCASITLSYLQNELGHNTVAKILSLPNEETKYVLKRFNIKIPELLNDVRLQISDVNYHRDFFINQNESVYHAYETMMNNNMSSIPVVSTDGKFQGVFAMKDIARKQILSLDTTLHSLYSYIIEVLDGKEIIKVDEKISGSIDNDIIITNQDINLNNKIKLLILTDNKKPTKEELELAKKYNINVISTDLLLTQTFQRIFFASFIKDYQFKKDIICVNENLEIVELNDIINTTKHSYYPVINNNNICLGVLKLSDLRDYKRKKVILVDHNELSQSVDGLEESEIISIIDHHKLGNLGTNIPINFRNMTVGSTCTIIYYMYIENKIQIPTNMASLLLSGLISDTLLLKSPTTTDYDRKVFNELVKITNLDAEKLALGMFKTNDAVNYKSLKEIVYTDYKTFNIDNKVLVISQINTLNAKAILKQKNSYIRYLNKECELKNYHMMVLSITDIFKGGSYIIFSSNAKNIIKAAFGDDIEQGSFLPNVISRKKQILPAIMNYIH